MHKLIHDLSKHDKGRKSLWLMENIVQTNTQIFEKNC